MKATVEVLNELAQEYAVEVPVEKNFAKQTAIKLYETVPIIYSCNPYRSAALRFKDQVNENCKIPARFDVFPELNHNAVVGYELPSTAKERIFVVLLHSPLLHHRIQLHYEGTAKLLDKSRIGHEFVEAAGETSLTQLMGLVLFGDYVSFYLAILNRIDPTPVDSIYFIKRYLAQFPTSTSQKSKQY